MPATKQDRAIVRALATRAVMEKTDRLLGWDGRVKVIPPNQDTGFYATPAWTDGKTITINGTQTNVFEIFHKGHDRDSMLWLSGLNYHELAHCFFTPRMNSDLANEVRHRQHWLAFNALEDQSAESKFVRLYNPARHYFTAVITKLMSGNKELVSTNYPLIAGRKFLPADLRRLFRENYALQKQISDIERIVDDYCDCVYPSDQTAMLGLIEEFQRLLDELQTHTGQDLQETSSHSHGDWTEGEHGEKGLTEGSPLKPSDQREITSKPQEGEDLDEQGAGESGEESDGEDEDADQSGSGGSSDGDGADQQGEGGEDGDGLPGGRGAGSYEGESKKWQPEILDDLIEQIEENAKEELSEELDSRAKSIRASESEYEVASNESHFQERPPEVEHTSAARGVEREFRRLNQKYKPGWNRRLETGKIDTNQIANIRRGRTDVFKQYKPGVHNALNFEVVMLLDQSGSMYRYVQDAGSALWVLHRAMRNIGAEITVLGYSDHRKCQVLMQRGHETPRMVRDYWSGGATYVMPALSEAQRVLRVSNKTLKLVVIVTDGVFSDPDQVRKSLSQMDDPVAIVGINEDVNHFWKPEQIKPLRVSKTIEHPSDLVPFTKDLVMDLAREKHGKALR